MANVVNRQIVGHYTQITLKLFQNILLYEKFKITAFADLHNSQDFKTIQAIKCDKITFTEPVYKQLTLGA